MAEIKVNNEFDADVEIVKSTTAEHTRLHAIDTHGIQSLTAAKKYCAVHEKIKILLDKYIELVQKDLDDISRTALDIKKIDKTIKYL